MQVSEAADAASNKSEAQQIREKHDAQCAFVVVIGKDGKATATLAADTPDKYKASADFLKGFIGNLPVVPFKSVFGWGNHGVPTEE